MCTDYSGVHVGRRTKQSLVLWYGALALPTFTEINAGRRFFRRTCHQELQQPRLDSCPAHVTSAPVVGNLRPPVWLRTDPRQERWDTEIGNEYALIVHLTGTWERQQT